MEMNGEYREIFGFPEEEQKTIFRYYRKLKQEGEEVQSKLKKYIEKPTLSLRQKYLIRSFLEVRGGKIEKHIPKLKFVLYYKEEDIRAQIHYFNSLINTYNNILGPFSNSDAYKEENPTFEYKPIDRNRVKQLSDEIKAKGKEIRRKFPFGVWVPKFGSYLDGVSLCPTCSCVLRKGTGEREMTSIDRETKEKELLRLIRAVNQFKGCRDKCGMGWICTLCKEREETMERLAKLKKLDKVQTWWEECGCGRGVGAKIKLDD